MIFGADKRATEELTFERTINPQYSTLHSWENYASDLATEYTQSIEEGKDIEKYSALFKAASGLEDGEIKQKLADIIFEIVLNAPTRADYRYNEPSDLETIKLVRPEDRPTLPKPDESALKAQDNRRLDRTRLRLSARKARRVHAHREPDPAAQNDRKLPDDALYPGRRPDR